VAPKAPEGVVNGSAAATDASSVELFIYCSAVDASAENRDSARILRRRLSLPEGLLWRASKAGKLGGLKFRKQHPVGPYVLDFYCHAARLCVEVDGGSHNFVRRPQTDDGTPGCRPKAYEPCEFQPASF